MEGTGRRQVRSLITPPSYVGIVRPGQSAARTSLGTTEGPRRLPRALVIRVDRPVIRSTQYRSDGSLSVQSSVRCTALFHLE